MILNHYEIFECLSILLWLYEGGYIFFPSLIWKKLSRKQYEQENTEKLEETEEDIIIEKNDDGDFANVVVGITNDDNDSRAR